MDRFDITVIPSIIFGVILKGGIYYTRDIKFGMSGNTYQILVISTGSRGDVFVVRTSKPVENL